MARQQVISPVDGSVYAERETLDPGEGEAVLRAAAAAQEEWRRVPLPARIELCERMVGHLLDESEDVAVELAWQMGRPVRHGPLEIHRGFQERARHMMAIAGASLADVEVAPSPGWRRFIRREPLGVVLVVAPWNYPYLTSVNVVVPALLAGNAVVLKHAAQTPRCAERYAEAFAAAGLPRGVFQHVFATHADVAAMIADERVGFVAFTGSVEGGHAVQAAASARFVHTGLELGGKDPSYVRPDADLAFAVAENADGAFFNSGQSCCAIERIYVHDDVYDEFVEGFSATARALVLGDPLDRSTTLGPMVSAAAADAVRGQVAEALTRGARAVVSEADFDAAADGTPYMGPTVLVDVDHSMQVMTEESFGPVIGIMRVGSDDEAVALMNDSRYGLTASVWTADADAALAIGGRIETGTVYMNRCDYLDPALAWTGVKDSGHGVTLSGLGYGVLTRPKSFHLRTATPGQTPGATAPVS